MVVPFDPAGIFGVLATHNVEYVLIGGLAAVVRGSPAMTNDADIFPAKTPANLERLAAALAELGARLRVESKPGGVAFDPHPSLLMSMATLNLTTKCGDLDLTFTPAALDDYDELVAASDEYELSGHRVQVAALADIIRSKESAGRAKDHATLPILYALQEEIKHTPQTRD
jgi:hypothetical protein